ncbi:hypothetical protein [Nitrosomonas sp.]|uniref:hypothetical protein n=1 Tax=Nitrosomonas sp. TaxID=42353 RepID=UPI0025D10C1F|nr:hypothetical protein [Nitrosomonas sp.]
MSDWGAHVSGSGETRLVSARALRARNLRYPNPSFDLFFLSGGSLSRASRYAVATKLNKKQKLFKQKQIKFYALCV